ncbi:MAG: DUF2079 domain-containing protein [Acidipropionibacterium sp.]|nr:DUF2079 domain-containing protein [Acidipropionibacterium sp.]
MATAALILALILLYSTYSMVRYAQFCTGGYDLGIFDQAVRHYAHLLPPYSPVKGYRYNLLGDHFHPLLAVFAPFYWIWDDPRVLLLGRALAVAFCAPILVRICDRRMSAVLSRLMVLVFMVSWPLQGLIDFDFHEICLAMPLLCLAFDALDRGRAAAFVVWSVLVLGVREDMGLVVAMLGMVWIVQPRRGHGSTVGRRERWTVGVSMILTGAIAFVLVVRVLIPHFAGGGTYSYWDYPGLGSGPSAMIGSIATDPGNAIHLMVDNAMKRQTLAWLALPFLCLFLFSPRWVLALPLVVERFWSSRELLWYPRFHYNAVIFLILFVASVDALESRPVRRWRVPVSWAVLAALAISIPMVHRANSFAEPFAQLPGKIVSRSSPSVRASRDAVALIPADVCVTADDRLVSHLTSSNRVTVPGASAPAPAYILLDMSRPDTGGGGGDPRTVLESALDSGYGVIFDEDAIVVLRGKDTRRDPARCGPTAP